MDGHEWTAKFEAPNGEPVLAVYPDPLTGGDPWTVGLGHTGPDVHKDEVWTRDRCLGAFYNDYAIAESQAVHLFGASCIAGLTVPRRAVLTDLCFNPGPGKLAKFVHMLDAIRRKDWQRASDELLDSAYAKQVKGRAIKNADVLLKGVWP
jgi:GH24 family phage-related lysozyme (muramidase)